MSDQGRRRAEAELNHVLAIDPTGSALVHGDLGGTNLLWSTDQAAVPRLTGVLDWDGDGKSQVISAGISEPRASAGRRCR